MRYGIFADVHSNLAALNAVLEAFSQEAIDRYVGLGDIVGYACQPQECIDRVRSLNPVLIAGNHDWACAGRLGLDSFTPLAGAGLIWTIEHLSEPDKQFLNSLPLVVKEDSFVLVHSTLDEPQEFYYLNSQSEAEATFALMDKNLCFVGHTHIPGVFTQTPDHLEYSHNAAFSISPSQKYIVNAGSVGQPRDGNPLASFCIFDSATNTVEIKRVAYDIPGTQQKIIAAGLPGFLAERLSVGR
ncbi:MAG: metallophosphoesterase family protein [Candidatus Omnitrophota bacterium]